jgi:hypothetical protein
MLLEGEILFIYSFVYFLYGGRWSSGKYVGTTCLRAAGSGPVPSAVWVFWRLILASDIAYGVVRQGFDPGLQVFLRERTPVAAQTHSCLQGWTHVRNY